MQLSLDLEIIETRASVELKTFAALPWNLPLMDPCEQMNVLADYIGLEKLGGFYREILKPRGFSILEFLTVASYRPYIDGNWSRPAHYVPKLWRPEKIRKIICKVFDLPNFPLGNPQEWRMPKNWGGQKCVLQLAAKPSQSFSPIQVLAEKPRRQMSEAAKLGMRKINAMRRAIKKYGWFAPEFLAEEYQRKGWTWGTEDDALWIRANLPPKKGALAQVRVRRKNDNDDFLGGVRA